MPYQLRPSERVPVAIRRIVREEISSAATQLSGGGEPDRDVAIHEARKSLKKIRGALRLMRPEIEPVYPAENAFFRDIGQQLSKFRDAGAMLETFDAMRERYRDTLGRRTLASIRRGLLARKEQSASNDEILKPLATALRESVRRVRAWPLTADGFRALEPGLEATFRKGRRALREVRQSPTPENYHEWRKRVKDHWYHVRLLQQFWDPATEAYEKNLKELETWLGDDHNLVVLEETLLEEPAMHGNPADVELFFRLILKYHDELRGKSISAGKHIYGEKPRRLIRHLQQLWD